MVGDGAVVAQAIQVDEASASAAVGLGQVTETVRIVLAPARSGYANEVVPVTSPGWRASLELATVDGVRSALVFSDGLTRLLLSRSRDGWSPFSPFFDSFLPRLADAPPAQAVEALVGGDEVDRAWDDDKCLVVLAHGP
jgi:hypothetical protein